MAFHVSVTLSVFSKYFSLLYILGNGFNFLFQLFYWYFFPLAFILAGMFLISVNLLPLSFNCFWKIVTCSCSMCIKSPSVSWNIVLRILWKFLFVSGFSIFPGVSFMGSAVFFLWYCLPSPGLMIWLFIHFRNVELGGGTDCWVVCLSTGRWVEWQISLGHLWNKSRQAVLRLMLSQRGAYFGGDNPHSGNVSTFSEDC